MSKQRKAEHGVVDNTSVEYRYGQILVEAVRRVTQASAGRRIELPVGEEMERALYNIGKFWKPYNVPAAVVAQKFVDRYSRQMQARQFRLSWLHGGQAAVNVQNDLKEEVIIAQRNGYNTGAAYMADIVYAVNNSLDYARALIRGAGIRLDDQKAVIEWLRLKIGSVQPVAAYVLSGYDREVVDLYREELIDEIAMKPATKEYLLQQGMPPQYLP